MRESISMKGAVTASVAALSLAAFFLACGEVLTSPVVLDVTSQTVCALEQFNATLASICAAAYKAGDALTHELRTSDRMDFPDAELLAELCRPFYGHSQATQACLSGLTSGGAQVGVAEILMEKLLRAMNVWITISTMVFGILMSCVAPLIEKGIDKIAALNTNIKKGAFQASLAIIGFLICFVALNFAFLRQASFGLQQQECALEKDYPDVCTKAFDDGMSLVQGSGSTTFPLMDVIAQSCQYNATLQPACEGGFTAGLQAAIYMMVVTESHTASAAGVALGMALFGLFAAYSKPISNGLQKFYRKITGQPAEEYNEISNTNRGPGYTAA